MSEASAMALPQSTRPHVIRRSRLDAMAPRIGASHVTMVSAPAGYGKTVAVEQWCDILAGEGRPILWLSAASDGASAGELLGSIVRSASELGVLPGAAMPESSRALADALRSRRNRPVLVIDDAHFLAGDSAAFLLRLVSEGQGAFTTILVSRGASGVPGARLRSLGYLQDIDSQALCFSQEEIRRFAKARIATVKITDDLVTRLERHTEGWAAGLILATDRQKADRSDATFNLEASSLTREIDVYFKEEIFASQPQDVRAFILETAVLDELTPATCAMLTDKADSQARLEALVDSGLFIQPAGDGLDVYRYHSLFRTACTRLLKAREPERAADLERRASLYFAAQDDPMRAVEHAHRSGDVDLLAQQLERFGEPLVYSGHLRRINELGEKLPRTILARHPKIALALAWFRIRALDLRGAEALIAIAAEYLQEQSVAGALAADEAEALSLLIEHRQIVMAAARDDFVDVERRAEALLARLGDAQPYLSSTLLALLIVARRELYHFQDVLKLEAETHRAIGRPDSVISSIGLKASSAKTLAVQGKVEAAEALLRKSLAQAQEYRDGGAGFASLPALTLAELLYDCGQSEEAGRLIDTYLPMARDRGYVDQATWGYVIKARLLADGGDATAALDVLHTAHLLAEESTLERLRAYVVGEQVRILLREGQGNAARDLFLRSGFDLITEPNPLRTPTRTKEWIAIAWIRLQRNDYKLAEARKVADRWVHFALRNGAIRSAAVFNLLRAEVAVLAGNRSDARRYVREAITLAAPAGWRTIFTAEGEIIMNLLSEAYGESPIVKEGPDLFAATIVSPGTGPDAEEFGLGARLVKREIDILRLVNGALRNREIGARLGLTEGTVKWYMQQIYDKLGVRRRSQAVIRARQLGLLR